MKDLSAGWEPLPLFHVFCLQGTPANGWIHDIALWEPCLADLAFFPPETGVRTSQAGPGKKGWLPFRAMTWCAADHRLWTTKYAAVKHKPDYAFSSMEAAHPTWAEQQRHRVNPTLWLEVSASAPTVYWGKPRGARHMLVLAAREEPAGIVDALARIAPRLATFSAMRARRKDLANLVHPGHPRADDGLREGETTWAAIDGVPLAACREDVVTAPDSAGPGRTFRHSDGRSIDARVLCGAVQLAIRDAEGDVAIRRRPASDPDAALDALVGELQADGFTPV